MPLFPFSLVSSFIYQYLHSSFKTEPLKGSDVSWEHGRPSGVKEVKLLSVAGVLNSHRYWVTVMNLF